MISAQEETKSRRHAGRGGQLRRENSPLPGQPTRCKLRPPGVLLALIGAESFSQAACLFFLADLAAREAAAVMKFLMPRFGGALLIPLSCSNPAFISDSLAEKTALGNIESFEHFYVRPDAARLAICGRPPMRWPRSGHFSPSIPSKNVMPGSHTRGRSRRSSGSKPDDPQDAKLRRPFRLNFQKTNEEPRQ